MRKNNIFYIIIIAFLLGMVFQEHCWSLKIPDIIIPDSVDPDLREKIDYITDIINGGRYVINVSSDVITSLDELDAGELLLDDSSLNKYLIVSNGTTLYRVEVTAVP